MKIRLLIIGLLSYISNVHGGQNSFELFLHGNELYKQGDYLQALEKYQEIEKPWYVVYAHIGDALYKVDNKLEALVYWRKAYDKAPFTDARKLDRSIAMVRNELGIEQSASLQQKLVTYMKMAPLMAWQLLLILICWLTVLISVYNRYRIIRRLAWLICIIYVVLLSSAYYYDIQPKAIMISNTVVYSGTDERLSTHHSIHAGQEVRILEHRNGWGKINYKSLDGWVRNDTFKSI